MVRLTAQLGLYAGISFHAVWWRVIIVLASPANNWVDTFVFIQDVGHWLATECFADSGWVVFRLSGTIYKLPYCMISTGGCCRKKLLASSVSACGWPGTIESVIQVGVEWIPHVGQVIDCGL